MVYLQRTDVIGAATDYIDERGVDALSMRRLGAKLGVEAMALYRHVPGRAQLLAAVVDQLFDELFDTKLMTMKATSWEAYLQHVAHALRNLALEHPRIFPLVAERPPEARWLRPPLRNAKWVDHFLVSLADFGFSDDHAVAAYKAFTSFLLGDLLLEAKTLAEGQEMIVSTDSGEIGDLQEYPAIERLHDKLTTDESEREFADGLDDLIERISSMS